MNLAVVNEAVTEMNGVEHQFTEEEKNFVVQFAFRSGSKEDTISLIEALAHSADKAESDEIMVTYRSKYDMKPAWVEQVENLLVALEMYRIEEEKAINHLADILTACCDRKTITGNLQRGHSPSLRLEVRMDLKDMILVTENDRGTETNMLMTLDDYKSFIAVDDMSELADNLLQLGRTLGEADNFAEYYRAANVTVSARFCLDDIQLGHFLQGLYNDSKEILFDKEANCSECVEKLKEIGMTDKGWVDDFNLHYESVDRLFERGQTFHNFNDHDYMVLEALSPRNLVVMDMKSGSLTIALGATEYKRYPKDEKPTKDNTTIGVSWEHGIYLGSTLSTTNFKAYKREYGTPEKIEDIYDYRAKLKQKFYFYQDMSKDDDVPKKLQNDFLHQMYEDFGTIEEDCFYDRLEDGKYDGGFKEKQVKEEKSR